MKKQKEGYIDGFVLSVPKKNTAKYIKMAREGSLVWKKFGALDYKECIIDDVKPKFVKFIFPKMARVRKGETVWFSFITYKSRAHRDTVNKNVMAHLNKKYGKQDQKKMAAQMPFDMKRMSYGGFKVMVG